MLDFGSGVWFCWLRAFVACVAGLVALDSENMVKANITLRDAKRLRSRRCLLRSSCCPRLTVQRVLSHVRSQDGGNKGIKRQDLGAAILMQHVCLSENVCPMNHPLQVKDVASTLHPQRFALTFAFSSFSCACPCRIASNTLWHCRSHTGLSDASHVGLQTVAITSTQNLCIADRKVQPHDLCALHECVLASFCSASGSMCHPWAHLTLVT